MHAAGLDRPALSLEPNLSQEMVLEQMLLTDQLRLHQYGVESSPAGGGGCAGLWGAVGAGEPPRGGGAPT